jgi:hypothetical protein
LGHSELPYLGKFSHFGKMLVQRSGNVLAFMEIPHLGKFQASFNCKWLKKLIKSL